MFSFTFIVGRRLLKFFGMDYNQVELSKSLMFFVVIWSPKSSPARFILVIKSPTEFLPSTYSVKCSQLYSLWNSPKILDDCSQFTNTEQGCSSRTGWWLRVLGLHGLLRACAGRPSGFENCIP